MFIVGTRVNARGHAGVIVDINFSSVIAPFEVKLDGWKETRWFYADELTLVEGSLPHSDSGDECQCAVCQTDPVPPPAKEELPIRTYGIDWAKPIQYEHSVNGWVDCRYIAGTGHEDGVIILYKNVQGKDIATIHYLPYKNIRNTPLKPRTCEAWVNVYDINGELRIAGDIYPSDDVRAKAAAYHYPPAEIVDKVKITYTEKPKGE
jgi:hypothetical protein